MRLLTFLAQVFINLFGITQPDEKRQRTVSLLLGGFLLAILIIVVGAMAAFFLISPRPR